jgi:hypothetical protein
VPKTRPPAARRPRVRRCAAALLLGVALAGCAAGAPTGTAGAAGVPASDRDLSPEDLEGFFGNGLQYSDDGDFGLDAAELVTTADAPGGTLLRVHYPAGSASRRADGAEGGMQVYLRLPDEPVDVLDMQYQVRFPADFDFVKGGKLPGLYGGTVTGGQEIPDGTNGFSTRYMWRAGGEGEVYAYLPTSQEHGTSLGRGCWSFPAGRWTTIQQRVRLNTPGETDGEVTVWQDGRQVLSQGGLEFRTTDALRIDGLFFSTFFGGGDTSWATPVDQYADFAAFTLANEHVPADQLPADGAAPAGGACAAGAAS